MKTSISDYELDRAETRGPEADGVDVEKALKTPKEHMSEPVRVADESVTKSKVVEAEDKPAPKKSTARTKAK